MAKGFGGSWPLGEICVPSSSGFTASNILVSFSTGRLYCRRRADPGSLPNDEKKKQAPKGTCFRRATRSDFRMSRAFMDGLTRAGESFRRIDDKLHRIAPDRARQYRMVRSGCQM